MENGGDWQERKTWPSKRHAETLRTSSLSARHVLLLEASVSTFGTQADAKERDWLAIASHRGRRSKKDKKKTQKKAKKEKPASEMPSLGFAQG